MEKHTSDDAVAFSFCSTIWILVSLTLLTFSVYGVADAQAETSTKKVVQIEDKIFAWRDTLAEEFSSSFSFKLVNEDGVVSESLPVTKDLDELQKRDDANKVRDVSRDIDSKFHTSQAYRQYQMNDYQVGFHEADLDGSLLFENEGQVDHLPSSKLQIELQGGNRVNLIDLGVLTYKQTRKNVKQRHQCETNFGGYYESGNKCTTYSLLRELCLVVKQAEGEQWELATKEDGSQIGCSNQNLEAGYYVPARGISLTQIPDNLKVVTLRLRSFNDPAVQALLITEGTYEVGIDPMLKLFLSLVGLLISIGCLIAIARQCIQMKHQEDTRFEQEERMRNYQMARETEDNEEDEEVEIDQDFVVSAAQRKQQAENQHDNSRLALKEGDFNSFQHYEDRGQVKEIEMSKFTKLEVGEDPEDPPPRLLKED